MMKTSLFLMLFTLAVSDCGQDGEARSRKAVERAKRIDVASLDSTLPSEPLQEWLTSGPPKIDRLEWQESDCDVKPDSGVTSADDMRCVRIVFHRGEVGGWMMLRLRPRHNQEVTPKFEFAIAFDSRGAIGKVVVLSQLPSLVERKQDQSTGSNPSS